MTSFLLPSQVALLEKCRVHDEQQQLLQHWLKKNEGENEKSSLDFLQLLGDLLLVAENHLAIKRFELAEKQKNTGYMLSPSETPIEILALEDTIKTSWQTASSLWLAMDILIQSPEEYGISLTSKHVDYAFQTQNGPVIELIRRVRPDFFNVSEPWSPLREFNWALCGICGAIFGLIGGLLGGIRFGLKQPGFKKLLFPFYALGGLFMGWATSAVMGADLGYRTGRFFLSIKLAFLAAFISPFHAPKGSRPRQILELKIEEMLFNTVQNEIAAKS